MLTQAQLGEYDTVGAIVVPDVLSQAEVAELRRVTDEFVGTRARSPHTTTFTTSRIRHSAEEPRVRRIKTPHLHHPAYNAAVGIPVSWPRCSSCGGRTSGSTPQS